MRRGERPVLMLDRAVYSGNTADLRDTIDASAQSRPKAVYAMYSGMRLAECEFVAVDLEATGPAPGRNSIIEIGAALLRDGAVQAEYERLVRPRDPVPAAVESLTGITSAMLVGSSTVRDAMEGLRDFAEGRVLVAHNYRFDLGFLDHESEVIWGRPWPRPVLDTLSLARRLHPGLTRYSLASLSKQFGAPTEPTHRALADARAAAEVLAAMLPDLERIGVHTVGELAAFCGMDRQTVLAEKLHLTADLPDEPGVFLFRDHDARVIYVGRAKSLRVRTRSYFYPISDDGRHDLGAAVDSLSAITTRSPLDAGLLERRLLERYDPEFNTAGQRLRTTYLLHAAPGPAPGLKVVTGFRTRGLIAGPFTSRWAALTLADRLSLAYGLRRCARRLGPKLASTPCEHRGTDCPSPCVLPYDADRYREDLERVFRDLEGDGLPIRKTFDRLQRDAASQQRYEDAIRFRDGIRALDRALGMLRTLRQAARKDAVIIEEDFDGVIVHLLRGGLRYSVVRGPRRSVGERVERALRRVYFSGTEAPDLARLTGRRIGEMLAIRGFLAAADVVEVPVTDETSTLAAVSRALGLTRRVPRRRHAGS